VNPETRNIISSKTATPSPLNYDIPRDNTNFKKMAGVAKSREERFFSVKNMPRIRAQVPLQYTSLDGVSAKDIVSASNRSSTLSKHIGG